jgi:DNA-binding response OmpR family regulator
MAPPSVLVVDDEESMRSIYCRFLAARGYRAAAAASAPEAATRIREAAPAVALVDIAMPGVDGIQLLRSLRQDPATARLPVVLMTGLSVPGSLLDSAAESLDAGPIFIKGGDLHDLLHRVDAALKDRALSRGGLVADPDSRRVWMNGREIVSPPARRFDLLCALLRRDGPVTREELLRAVWPDSANPNLVDVTVHRLRVDLKECPSVHIKATQRGYRLGVTDFGTP